MNIIISVPNFVPLLNATGKNVSCKSLELENANNPLFGTKSSIMKLIFSDLLRAI